MRDVLEFPFINTLVNLFREQLWKEKQGLKKLKQLFIFLVYFTLRQEKE